MSGLQRVISGLSLSTGIGPGKSVEAKSPAQSWDGATHAEAISYGIWGHRGVPAVGKQNGMLLPLLVDGSAGTGPAESQTPWLNHSGTSGNCTSLNTLCCLMGQCWLGTLPPRTHTGRSSQRQMPLPAAHTPIGTTQPHVPACVADAPEHSPVPFPLPSASYSGSP